MTGDNAEARDELRAIIEDLQHEVHRTRDNLERGPEPGAVPDAVDRIERNSQELLRFAEEVQDAVDELSGGSYSDGVLDLDEGARDAYEHLDSVLDLLGALENVLDEMADGEDADATTKATIDGTVYEVSFRAVREAEEPFSERLGRYLNDNEVSPEKYAHRAEMEVGRVEELLAGSDTPTDNERETLADLTGDDQNDDEDDEDSLGELFG